MYLICGTMLIESKQRELAKDWLTLGLAVARNKGAHTQRRNRICLATLAEDRDPSSGFYRARTTLVMISRALAVLVEAPPRSRSGRFLDTTCPSKLVRVPVARRSFAAHDR